MGINQLVKNISNTVVLSTLLTIISSTAYAGKIEYKTHDNIGNTYNNGELICSEVLPYELGENHYTIEHKKGIPTSISNGEEPLILTPESKYFEGKEGYISFAKDMIERAEWCKENASLTKL